jgi:hypothetical protein
MKRTIEIPEQIYRKVHGHLFQNKVEQGAFLFARHEQGQNSRLVVVDFYLVPRRGWEVQEELYLEMRDSERGKIMRLARNKKLAAIDCHSHPHAEDDVWFSTSDVAGITEFSKYARWKLDGKPFVAMVFGKNSVDAVQWDEDFVEARPVDAIRVRGKSIGRLVPNGSWFKPCETLCHE